MATVPQTWLMLQAIQYRIWSEILVNGASPFSTFTPADEQRFGTNPQGTVTTAVFIGVPADWDSSNYPVQCQIIPPINEHVYRRALTGGGAGGVGLGGKIWDEQDVYVRFLVKRSGPGSDWYQALQTIITMRDAAWPVFARHAELPQVPTVRAVQPQPPRAVPAYHHEQVVGVDWDAWGYLLRNWQEWYAPNGIIP